MSTKRDKFIRLLAEYLVDKRVGMSFRLEMRDTDAEAWATLHAASPLFGYIVTDEAEQQLREFLLEEAPKATEPSKFACELTETLVSEFEDVEEYLHGGSTNYTDVQVALIIYAAISARDKKFAEFLDTCFEHSLSPGDADGLLQQFHKQEEK